MKVLFSGNQSTYGGPAEVNRSYLRESREWLSAPVDRPGTALTLHLVRYHRRYGGVLVSSLSAFHLPLILTARMFGIHTWYLAHGIARDEMRINNRRSWKVYFVELLIITWVHDVIAVSTVLRDRLMIEFDGQPARFHSILNGAEASRPDSADDPVSAEASDSTSVIRIVTVGAYPIKNVATLCEAVDRVPGSHLTVIGDSTDGQSLVDGLPEVTYVGELQPDQVRWHLDESHIYAQVSLSEAFGLAICEAAQAGCELLVSSSVGCLPVLSKMGPENLVCDVTDVDEVVRKLVVLSARIRSGRARVHECKRTWAAASEELRQLVCG